MDDLQYKTVVDSLGRLVNLLIDKGVLTKEEASEWCLASLDFINKEILKK